jgi:hypothetical protein
MMCDELMREEDLDKINKFYQSYDCEVVRMVVEGRVCQLLIGIAGRKHILKIIDNMRKGVDDILKM